MLAGTLVRVTMMTRVLGRSGIPVSALGVGCWAIGGPWWGGDQPLGWGKVDDDESVRAIRRALDLGVTFFDTADTYGAGHSEQVLGLALGSRRDEVVIATKWGNTFNAETKQATGADATPEYLPRAVRASLSRLGTDRIDLYQLHLNDLPAAQALDLIPVLEDLVTEGLIRRIHPSVPGRPTPSGSLGVPENSIHRPPKERHIMAKQLRLGLFENAQANDSGTATWRHPDNKRYLFDSLDYWRGTARMVEDAGFDFLFLADAWGWADVAGDRPEICSVEGLDLPRLDPESSTDVGTVLGNLVDNAVDASVSVGGTSVEVTLCLEDDVVRLAVADSGPGVPPDEVGRIFDRGWSSKAPTAEGRGVGLALVQVVCERRGGAVGVRAGEDGTGAVFEVRLPGAEVG